MTGSGPSRLPGSIYPRKSGQKIRYYWRGVRPGQSRPSTVPLRPVGAAAATTDRKVAQAVLRDLWRGWERQAGPEGEHEDRSVGGLRRAFVAYAHRYYVDPEGRPTGNAERFRWSLGYLDPYDDLEAEEFGPLKLSAVRDRMIAEGLAARTINQRMGEIRQMFRWAVAQERVSATVYQALTAVVGVGQNRFGVRPGRGVGPIDRRHVFAVLPYASPVVAAMIAVQWHTGMRSKELVEMRPCEIDASGESPDGVGWYRPARHKTAYRRHGREIALGPACRAVLAPYLQRPADRPCFSPTESEERRLTARESRRDPAVPPTHGHYRGSRAAERDGRPRRRPPGDAYTTQTYRRAVAYAIRKARQAGLDVPDWTPHQMRHARATIIRDALSADHAQVALGHATIQTTEHYARIRREKAAEAARELG